MSDGKKQITKWQKILIGAVGAAVVAVISAVCIFTSGRKDTNAMVVRIIRTEGTVTLYDDKDSAVPVLENMRVYDGYRLVTDAQANVQLSLDETKIITLTENGELTFHKDGKALALNVSEGQIFFNVKEKLAEDETFEIETSTMVVGIRGTSAFVDTQVNEIFMTDGTTALAVKGADDGEQAEIALPAGHKAGVETAEAGFSDREYDLDELPVEALKAIGDDEELITRIAAATGWPVEDLKNRIAKAMAGEELTQGEEPEVSDKTAIAESSQTEKKGKEEKIEEEKEEQKEEQDTEESPADTEAGNAQIPVAEVKIPEIPVTAVSADPVVPAPEEQEREEDEEEDDDNSWYVPPQVNFVSYEFATYTTGTTEGEYILNPSAVNGDSTGESLLVKAYAGADSTTVYHLGKENATVKFHEGNKAAIEIGFLNGNVVSIGGIQNIQPGYTPTHRISYIRIADASDSGKSYFIGVYTRYSDGETEIIVTKPEADTIRLSSGYTFAKGESGRYTSVSGSDFYADLTAGGEGTYYVGGAAVRIDESENAVFELGYTNLNEISSIGGRGGIQTGYVLEGTEYSLVKYVTLDNGGYAYIKGEEASRSIVLTGSKPENYRILNVTATGADSVTTTEGKALKLTEEDSFDVKDTDENAYDSASIGTGSQLYFHMDTSGIAVKVEITKEGVLDKVAGMGVQKGVWDEKEVVYVSASDNGKTVYLVLYSNGGSGYRAEFTMTAPAAP